MKYLTRYVVTQNWNPADQDKSIIQDPGAGMVNMLPSSYRILTIIIINATLLKKVVDRLYSPNKAGYMILVYPLPITTISKKDLKFN